MADFNKARNMIKSDILVPQDLIIKISETMKEIGLLED